MKKILIAAVFMVTLAFCNNPEENADKKDSNKVENVSDKKIEEINKTTEDIDKKSEQLENEADKVLEDI